jgi:transposase
MKELLVGVDWSQSHYDIAVVAPNGALLTQFRIAKTAPEFSLFAEKIEAFGVPATHCHIGLETAHNILIDFLWSRQYATFVIAPSIVKSSRGRFGNSGAYTDAQDAHLIADLLRTDRERFAPWRPDSELLMRIKTKLGHVDHLTKLITSQTNRLRSILLRVYPQVLQAFNDLHVSIVLHLLVAYPTAAALAGLSYAEFAAFCRSQHCHRLDWITTWYSRLQQTQPPVQFTLAAAYQDEIVFMAQQLISLIREKKQALQQAQALCQQHPDWPIFVSLPGTGDMLQPKLLVMFGEDRARFPSPQDMRALAGTCPVTKQSGKRKCIQFRRACNHSFRETAHQLAVASVQRVDWAAAYFTAALARGLRKNHAYRCLANRWLGIIWKLWQTRQLYDEAYHLQQIHQQRRPT